MRTKTLGGGGGDFSFFFFYTGGANLDPNFEATVWV